MLCRVSDEGSACPQNLYSVTNNISMVRLRGAREKGTMVLRKKRSFTERHGRRPPVEGILTQEPGIIIVNPSTSSIQDNTARREENHLTNPIEREKNEYRGSFPATFSLLPLAISTCGEIPLDVHVLIEGLSIRRVEYGSEIHSNES